MKANLNVRLLALAALVAAAFGVHYAVAQNAPAGPDATAKAALEAYAKAINEKNHDAIAGFWADNAEHIGDDGTIVNGKANIAAMLKKVLADNPKLSVKLTSTAVKMLGNDVLLIDGLADITNGDDSDTSRFESLWVRAGNSWQLSRVRELPGTTAGGDNNYEQLKPFEWLVGDWSSSTGAYTVTLNVKWGKHRNWLLAEQVVSADGKEAVTVTKILGYDPAVGQLRSWVFDSDGGFGGGYLSRTGNTWQESADSTTRNGGDATAVHSMKYIDENNFEWSSTGRQVDGAPLPDVKIKYTRKAAK